MHSKSPDSLWRPRRDDAVPTLVIVLAAFAVAAPQLLGYFHADPALYVGEMANDVVPGLIRGVPYIDPNNGFGTQALGIRAMRDWLAGTVPWWNPWSGAGLPLAAEYQPGAFSPLTWLLLLPDGMAWQQLALSIASGLGTYALLRQLGLARTAATMGGLAYAFNGTLAWFAHASATPVPWLPWFLLGIERAYARCAAGGGGGWRLVAVAMALSLLAPFPETAYISGLLALAWAVLRAFQLPGPARGTFIGYIALGGTVGILLAAPQLVAFAGFLLDADIGGHANAFAFAMLNRPGWITSLIAPYAYGPPFAYATGWEMLMGLWGGIGGYVTVLLLLVATYGFAARRDALSWLLAGWSLLSLMKSFGFEPGLTLLNLVPGVTTAAFARYVQPSWELAFVILAACGVDALARSARPNVPALWVAGVFASLVVGCALVQGIELWPHLHQRVGLRNSAVASATWAIVTVAAGCILLIRAARNRKVAALAALVAFDAMLMYAIPTLSNPRGGRIDQAAIAFLRANLGLQRFFTLGPIQPNYGAQYEIASINHNYLPVSRRWAAWVKAHLAADADDAVSFDGRRPTAPAELRRNIEAYEWAGVKYVVARTGLDPFAPADTASADAREAKLVYRDRLLDIIELPRPRAYFEALEGDCAVEPRGREIAVATCAAPALLLRREQFATGWEATIDGREAPIVEHRDLFQAVALPAGRSEVRFRYAPPHIAWGWTGMLAALLLFCFLRVPRK